MIEEQISPNWGLLVYPGVTRKEIKEYVLDSRWQEFRTSLLGLPSSVVFLRLIEYTRQFGESVPRSVQVQVTNYVNALKRGGKI
jgi:hypothetical protein